jgi:uncharacterized protein YabN with tetrapyrrole methylase and pyrophosphatase domain
VSLSVVGTGIQTVAQTSLQAKQCIENADRVHVFAADAVTEHWIGKINEKVNSLNRFYEPNKDRAITYEQMIDAVLNDVASDFNVCLVSYGHPGVFAYPTHEAVRRARDAGYHAQMLPAVSSDACLFADLGVDPGATGCQSFEATDFLIHHRRYDPHSILLLWQIGVIGEAGYKSDSGAWNREGVRVLTAVLREVYPSDHVVSVYEAARYACCKPKIVNVRLEDLPEAAISVISTLYVPPIANAQTDLEMLARLTATSTSCTSA